MTEVAEDPLGLIGTTVDDKYVVEKVVGEGGFAVVYKAMHKLWQKPVALKCFKTLMDASPQMREKLLQSFVQEGALLTELSARSASIVQARDIGTLTTSTGAWVPYMVLEWLEGTTLDQLMEKEGMQPWPMDRVMETLEPVAEACDLAHRRNIAHRDIKPANIFVIGETASEHPVIKLLDFGIAKVVQSAADQGFTKTGGQVTSFTPSYGAPEQFSRANGATGPWTDVYALALIVTELLSGKFALEGDDFIQLGMASADPSRRPTPRTLGVSVDDPVEDVMIKALAIKPPNRYQSAGEFWNAMRIAVGQGPLRRVTTTPLEPSGGPRSTNTSRGALAATEFSPGATPTSISGGTTKGANTAPGAELAAAAPQAKKSPIGLVLGGVAVVGAIVAGVLVLKSKNDPPKSDPGTKPTNSAVVPASASSAAPVAKCPAGMAEIPGGPFFMGSDKGEDEEKPAHKVTLAPYCMDLKEVTVAEYEKCRKENGGCKRIDPEVSWPDITDKQKKLYAPLCNITDPAGKGDHPINCITWELSKNFCESTGKRLPTEAEWEFAARGPGEPIYPWGDEPPDETRLNACGKECVAWGKKVGEQVKAMYEGDDGYPNTAPVGKFPKGASRYGLLDVVGNVWEWTNDWDGMYTTDAQTDPKGPEKGTDRVVRGGAWNGSFPSWVRPSQRYSFPPATKSHAVGFRCAKSQN